MAELYALYNQEKETETKQITNLYMTKPGRKNMIVFIKILKTWDEFKHLHLNGFDWLQTS